MIPQSYFRYAPISPTYDPNEFVKNYNKKSHQKFRQLRPAKKRPYRWIFEFLFRDWLELDEILPTLTTKTKNSKKFCQKSASQSRKIRKNHDFHENFSLKFLSILCRKRVRIEVELFAQNRPPLFLWSLPCGSIWRHTYISNKESFLWLVLGCINEFCNFANIAQHGTTSCI